MLVSPSVCGLNGRFQQFECNGILLSTVESFLELYKFLFKFYKNRPRPGVGSGLFDGNILKVGDLGPNKGDQYQRIPIVAPMVSKAASASK